MFRNLVTSLLKHGRIETTLAKAKELRKWAEKMISLGKRGDLHARRQALSVVQEESVVKKLFAEIAPSFKDRNGGYSRITKLGLRQGDAAPMAMIELIGLSIGTKTETAKKKEKKAAEKTKEAAKPEKPAKTAKPEEKPEKKEKKTKVEKPEKKAKATKEDVKAKEKKADKKTKEKKEETKPKKAEKTGPKAKPKKTKD